MIFHCLTCLGDSRACLFILLFAFQVSDQRYYPCLPSSSQKFVCVFQLYLNSVPGCLPRSTIYLGPMKNPSFPAIASRCLDALLIWLMSIFFYGLPQHLLSACSLLACSFFFVASLAFRLGTLIWLMDIFFHGLPQHLLSACLLSCCFLLLWPSGWGFSSASSSLVPT